VIEQRPDPDELLARTTRDEQRSQRGKLVIFFGAAPGVGKTYAMLAAAQAQRSEGVDVLIGWVETHGRRETEQLAWGLERLPPRKVDYRGVQLREFDLDAALARRPQQLVLDELAHTNAAGSRHARRWQDVEELLAAGIDVATTLNVQHVESLNDIVAQITGVQVRETVPDRIFDTAHEVRLIDLPSEELLRRLRDGKVYVPAQAELARDNFFRKGNLLALRELALRRTAERVDAQSEEWRRDEGVQTPWGVRECVVVLVESRSDASDLVRAAYRTAARARARWLALSIETPELERCEPQAREAIDSALALSGRLGAETAIVRGEHVAEEVLAFCRERGVTRLFVGRPVGPWHERLRRVLTLARLVRGAGAIDIVVSAGDSEAATRPPTPSAPKPFSFAAYGVALAMVALCTAIGLLMGERLAFADLSMLYLLGVLIVASRAPRGPSLASAITSVAALNFFFVSPYYTLIVDDLRYVLSFSVMLIVALTVSTFTVRLREQAGAAQQRERRTAALYAMSRQFVVETGVGAIAEAAIKALRDNVDAESFILLADSARNLIPCGGAAAPQSDRELAVARWVHEHGRLAGFGTDTLPASECLYIPLVGTAGHIGVFGVALARRAAPLTPFQWQTLETFVAQTALALERALLVERNSTTQVAMETERARNDLLSAITHDVRTPLTTISGSAQTLLTAEERLEPAKRRELLNLIRSESERLARMVNDLLDLTRAESGALEVRKEPCPMEEVMDSALARVESLLGPREVLRSAPDEVALAPLDPVLMEQVLVNLLENACKYSAPDTPIEVSVALESKSAVFEVRDRGFGLAEGEQERVFERFFRSKDGARAPGSGLGLTVSRAIVRAHGGEIRALQREGGGTVFRVELPLEPQTRPRSASETAR
jgi:two-component system sensor histidine kinase KdpD